MATITDNGFEPITIQELQDEASAKAKSKLGGDFPTTPESVYGVQSGIISASLTDLYQLLQEAVNQQNRLYATGVYLDYLANIIGLSRIRRSGSTGDLLFIGSPNTVIPANTVAENGAFQKVLTRESLTLQRSNCYSSYISVNTIAPSTNYSIYVGGVEFTYVSDIDPTETEIVQGLADAIGVQTLYTATADLDNLYVIITYNLTENLLSTTNSGNLKLTYVGSLVSAEAADFGAIEFPANTITSLVSSIVSVISVDNPDDFTQGRDTETDAELRQRMAEREQSTGTATIPAISSSLSEVTGVTGVIVVENNTMDEDIDGRPAKSYECYVSGGNEDDIAEVVWSTKPAGIETWGTINKTVIDSNGDPQGVRFSRKIDKYGWFRITYSINSEETFPSNGEDLMSTYLVDEGDQMYSGEDFEPTKFYSALYRVQGVYISQIEIAITDTALGTPTYVTTRIPISKFEELYFDTSRVSFILV